MKKTILVFSFLLIALCGFTTMINVPSDYTTIQGGIDASSTADTVLVQPGTYVENINFNGKNIVLGSLYLTTNDTTYISSTIINGNNWDKAVYIAGSDSLITKLVGFSIINGLIGIEMSGDSTKVQHCRIYNNNHPGDSCGGGVVASGGIIEYCEVFGNHARHGGGMHLSGSIVVKNCNIYSNTCNDNGSQLQFGNGAPKISNCIITATNSQQNVIEFRWGTLAELENILIINNDHDVFYSWDVSNPILKNVTIINIESSNANLVTIGAPSYFTIKNSIVYGFTLSEVTGVAATYSMFNNSVSGIGNIVSDPLFVDTANGDFHLSDYSPCIGAGTATGAPSTDIEGNPRPNPPGSNPDMGAYENILSEPSNNHPTIDVIDDVYIFEDDSMYTMLLTNIDDGDFTYSQNITISTTCSDTTLISSPNIYYTPNDSTGSLTFTPQPDKFGTAIITIKLKDDGGITNGGIDSLLVDVSIFVSAVNDPPILTITGTYETDEDLPSQAYDFTSFCSQAWGETDVLTLSASNSAHINVIVTNFDVIFESNTPNWNGTENIIFYLDDNVAENRNSRDIVEQTIQVTVNPINDPPILNITGTFEADEDLPSVTYDFTQYCSQTFGETDVLTLTASSSSHIDVTVNDFDVIFESNTLNWNGTEDVTFYLDDNVADSRISRDIVEQTIQVTINPINDPPSIVLPDAFTFDEDGSLMEDFTNYVGDIDPDNLTLSYTGNTEIIVNIVDLEVTFSAPENWFGSEVITFTVNDNVTDLTATDDVLVIVNPVNDPPILNITGTFEADEDLPSATYNFTQYCSQTFGETDVLTLSAVNSSHINVTITNFDVIFESNTLNWNGTEDITFYLDDNVADSRSSRDIVEQTIQVTVNPINDPPSIVLPDDFTFDEDGSLVEDFITYIDDVDPDNLTLSASGSTEVIVDIVGTLVTFSATDNWNGTETMIFTVNDNSTDATASDSVEVVVTPVNDEPIILGFIPEDLSFIVYQDSIVTFSVNAEDVDSELTYEWYIDNVLQDSVSEEFSIQFTDIGENVVKSVVSDEEYSIETIWDVTVGEPIIADFEASPLIGYNPLEVQFSDLSSGGLTVADRTLKNTVNSDNTRDIISWEWDFNNDGFIDSNEQNPLWTYTTPGSFTVTLTVSDGFYTGSETKIDYIVVGDPVVADFEATPTEGVLPLNVQFTDLSNGGLPERERVYSSLYYEKTNNPNNSRDINFWEWDFDNDGSIDSNEQNPEWTYTETGFFTVTLTVSDGTNSDTLTQEDLIIVNPDIEFSYQTSGAIESGVSLLSEDILYCASSGDCVYRFDGSGQIEYTLSVNGDIQSATTITPDHNVYIASTDFNLYSFNSNGVSNTGWPLSLGSEATASVASDSLGNIYIGTQNGIFQAVDPFGENIWSYNVGAPVHSSAVISSENTLYVVNTDGKLYAFDLNSIIPNNVDYKWILETNSIISSTPALDDMNNIYLTNENGQLIKIHDDGTVGNIVWTFETGTAIIDSSPIIDSNYNIYFGCEDGKVYSVNNSGQLNWMSEEFLPIKSTGALFESEVIPSRIYIGSDDGKLYALSIVDGSTMWQFTTNSAIKCPILYDSGKIYFGTLDGEVFAINDQDVSNVATFRNNSIWSTFQGNNQRTGYQSINLTSTENDIINSHSNLWQNYPNPFNPLTTINFDLHQISKTRIEIYNVKGQKVKTLVNTELDAGNHTVIWNGDNSSGKKVSSGIYFYKMIANGKNIGLRKCLMMK